MNTGKTPTLNDLLWKPLLFGFLTAEMTLPPGLIAFIYKCRWDIEKVFDQNKNKLGENKAWAKSPTAE